MTVRIGWDIGGAHLKVACFSNDVLSAVAQLPCPLWRGKGELERAWRRGEALPGIDNQGEHTVTMTGELADCFASRKAGVVEILTEVAQHLQKPFKVYAGAAGFIDARDAARYFAHIASANWHATATCLVKLLGHGVLVDIGSTTTDIVPFSPAGVMARGSNDRQRLCSQELVYTGVVRTPVMALVDRVRVGGEAWPVVAELFATAADVYRVLGQLPDNADQGPTCDGAAKTPEMSARRLARMFGCDAGDADDWTGHARALAAVQMDSIEVACRKVCAVTGVDASIPVVGAGVGRFLARGLARRVGREYVDFASLFDVAGSENVRLAGDCASAVSVALLMARES